MRLQAATKPPAPSAVAQLAALRSLEVHLPRVPEEHGSTEGPQRLGVRPDVVVLEPVDDRLVGTAAPTHDRDGARVGDALQLGDGHGTVPSLVEVQHSQASEYGLHRADLIAWAIGGERGVSLRPGGVDPCAQVRAAFGNRRRRQAHRHRRHGRRRRHRRSRWHRRSRAVIDLVGSSAFASARAPGGQRDRADERGQLRTRADQWTTASEMISRFRVSGVSGRPGRLSSDSVENMMRQYCQNGHSSTQPMRRPNP